MFAEEDLKQKRVDQEDLITQVEPTPRAQKGDPIKRTLGTPF
ncbi:MAG: hypothetical protein OXC67_02310 [Flavobacteriaceae bacterium]|nr:hypothetical protein [Flavobacteriaceae bacterium]